MSVKKGQFIVFEGPDGSRKTSLLAALTRGYKLSSGAYAKATFTYRELLTTCTPSYLRIGQLSRELIHPDSVTSDMARLYIFLADMHEVLRQEIIPTTNKGCTSISDRWWYSTYAYQGEVIDKDLIIRLSKELNPQPDLIIKLSISPANQMGTLDAKEKDYFESKGSDYFLRVEERYREIFSIIDTPVIYVNTDDFDLAFSQISEIIKKRISNV
jgi:dTMP kinase